MTSKNAVKEQILVTEVESQAEASAVSPVQGPSREEIRRRAFEIHIKRGRIHGCDLDDWLHAERELENRSHHNETRAEKSPGHDNSEFQNN